MSLFTPRGFILTEKRKEYTGFQAFHDKEADEYSIYFWDKWEVVSKNYFWRYIRQHQQTEFVFRHPEKRFDRLNMRCNNVHTVWVVKLWVDGKYREFPPCSSLSGALSLFFDGRKNYRFSD